MPLSRVRKVIVDMDVDIVYSLMMTLRTWVWPSS